MFPDRVLSGMRPTGRLHIGHYHGALKNWAKLQHEYPCFFFVADWHALTTHYETPEVIEAYTYDTVIDFIAAGIDPAQATLFAQSKVPQHAELTLLLSFFTPLSWLERVPTYKDQKQKLGERGHDLATYGFLGYPLMQAADILIYRTNRVPVGEDQVSHVELTREIARRFNHLFGREKGFEEKAEAAIKKLGSKKAKLYNVLRTRFQQDDIEAALKEAHDLLGDVQNLSMGDRERLFGYLEGGGKVILPEPQALLTPTSKLIGLDGQKMSKSYGNTIDLRDDEKTVTEKVSKMPTDPARVRRTDPGDPEKCPVWSLHQVYSDETVRRWVVDGCKSAGIGCLDCKQPVIDGIVKELKPMRERTAPFEEDPMLVKNILADGCEKARDVAEETMRDVRDAMGLNFA